jgi:hypothetical protein
LLDVESREWTIPLNAIEEKAMAGSIMPAGLTDNLTRAELINLVRFLSELGKIGPYSAGTQRVCRRWQVLEPTPEALAAEARGGLDALVQDEGSLTWRPAYATVAGLLPLSEWSGPGRSSEARPIALARTQLQVTTPGRVKLSFNSAAALTFWLDGRRIEPDRIEPDAVLLDLSAGLHTLTLAVDPGRRGEGIRCVLEDVLGSPARAQVVLGK